jgi:hypothetical protein
MGGEGRVYGGDAFADPAHDRHGHGVAAGLVARAVGTFILRLALPRYAAPVIWEALQAFALDGGEATDCHRGKDAMLVAALLESKGRVARFKVLKAMLLSAWAETRQ